MVTAKTIIMIPHPTLTVKGSPKTVTPKNTAVMALDDNSVSIDDPQLVREEKLAIVLGTEGDGLAAGTIADCDYTVKIPMYHGVDSLNVAAASAVAFWEMRRR